MNHTSDPWVIILAAGSGTRLSELTVGRDGIVVPKQFCSLRGGRTLLLATIDRALRVTRRQRIVVVVAAEHERWWRPQLTCIDVDNVIVQPRNCGTAAGLMLPLAHILESDPEARVAVLPSDHYVQQPATLTHSLRCALTATQDDVNLVLLGITPDTPDSEYGWIVPGTARNGDLRTVAAFVEKPPPARAATLMQAGSVWNSFLFTGTAKAMWQLCEKHAASTARALAAAWSRPVLERSIALDAVYHSLPSVDFSRVVLGSSAANLRLLLVPECGWTDLGTPRRVADCLARIERINPRLPVRSPWFSTVDLSAALADRRQFASQTA